MPNYHDARLLASIGAPRWPQFVWPQMRYTDHDCGTGRLRHEELRNRPAVRFSVSLGIVLCLISRYVNLAIFALVLEQLSDDEC